MIRIIVLFVIFFTLRLAASAQVFVCEDFSQAKMPPEGWTIEGFPNFWSISYAYWAGGMNVPEAQFSYVDQINADSATSRLISPVINLTGIDSVKIHFWYYFAHFGKPAPLLGMATRSAGGAWNTVWHVQPNGTLDISEREINLWLKNSDVGSSQFQFCMYLEGNFYHLSHWNLDDITLSRPVNRDGFLTTLGKTPDHVTAPFAVHGLVVNTGSDSIHSIVIDWMLNNGPIHSTNITGLKVPSMKSFQFKCSDSVSAHIGTNNLVVWIRDINGAPDEFPANDTLSMTINRVSYLVPRKPLFEEFTSSTCIYCPLWDDIFNPWCDSIGEKITVVKYEMDWPGVGDIYYTPEGGVRSDFYTVQGVPEPYCDGGESVGNGDLRYARRGYNADVKQQAMMSLQATHKFTGHSISVKATVVPYANFSVQKLYIAVVENATYNNVGASRDTFFRFVEMKMIPDGYGIPLDLADRRPLTYTGSADLTNTHIERWYDLKVVVWVEDTVSKIVSQSCYSVENADLATEARLRNILVDTTGVAGFDPDIFHYWVPMPGIGSITYPVKGIPIDPKETVIVIPASEVPGTTTLDVYAQDNQFHNRYIVDITTVGIPEEQGRKITSYPNPATDKVFIYGAEHARVSLYTSSGLCVRMQNNFTGNAFSLEGISRGLYLLKIEMVDGSVVPKKIMVK